MTIPFSKYCDEVIGVDVSELMLTIARERSKGNIIYLQSDDDLSAIKQQKYDLIHTYIVLQHIPVVRGYKIIERLLDHMNDKGVAVIHYTFDKILPFRTKLSRFLRQYKLMNSILNLLTGRTVSEPFRQMNTYNLRKVFKMIISKGIKQIYCEFTNHGGYLGITMFIKK